MSEELMQRLVKSRIPGSAFRVFFTLMLSGKDAGYTELRNACPFPQTTFSSTVIHLEDAGLVERYFVHGKVRVRVQE